MPLRIALGILALLLSFWFGGCSSGLGKNRPPRPTPPNTAASSNQPVGFDLGVLPTSAVGEPAVAGVVIPAIGTTAQREVVLLGFATSAAADDGDGSGTGNSISRDATTDTNAASDVFVAAIVAQDIEKRAFSQSLAGKFRHPRCTTCHSMQATNTNAFVSSATLGEPHAGPPPGSMFPNNDPATCIPCHTNQTTFPVVGWQAPAASFDMRTETVAQLADRATRVPAGDLEHFVTDARVLWALDSGILPQVGGRNGRADDDHDGVVEPEDTDGTARTVPGGSVNFIREIEEWRASGQIVTAAAAVKDITLVSRAAGTTNAPNGASSKPKLLWVPNATFNPSNSVTAAATNPIGTLYVAFESTGSDLAAGDGNGASDVFRATLQLRAEENSTGVATTGGLNLVYLDGATILASGVNGGTAAGNGAATAPAIGGSNGQFVAFQSLATNLVAGFTDGNGAGSDVFVRTIGANTTVLVSHAIGNIATGGNGASEKPALDPTGVGLAFESVANDLIGSDTNGVRDVFHARIDGAAPFTHVRSSVTASGVEGTGGDSTAPSIQVSAAGRILVAFQSAATNLAPGLVAPTNVFLFDSATGFTTLLNQRISADGNAIGDGSARAPAITPDGARVMFESDASNIDVVRGTDGNRATDVFLVETAQLAGGNVLPFRISMTATEAADADGASTGVAVGNFTGSALYPVGFVAYTTAATNLGTADSTNVMVSFLSETSGVFADFSANTQRGAAPLTVQFTDTSSGSPTSWQWDFDNDGSVDSTQQNPAFVYAAPGVYSVRLVARNAISEGTTTKTGFIVVVGAPDADFTVAPASGVAPLTVSFTDASTQSPTGWAWDFTNDGTIDSTVQNPTGVSYPAPGSYDVRLVVTNEVGSNTEIKAGVVQVFAPVVAAFTVSTSSGPAPLSVDFTNTSTGATSFSWDFGDGSALSTATSPSHVFNAGGTPTVTLTATGPGGTATASTTITVNSSASFTMTVGGNPITSAYESTNITFTSTSAGGPTSFAWDFDSVSNPNTLTASGSPVTRNFANTTASTRTFVVKLTVNGPGGLASIQRNLTIVSDTETVTLDAVADNTIYSNATNNSNGIGEVIVAGNATTTGGPRRSLLRFDVVGTGVPPNGIPANSTISLTTPPILRLTQFQPTGAAFVPNGNQVFNLHRVTQAWVEGTSDTNIPPATPSPGAGAAAAGGGATWTNRNTAPVQAWTTAGGTFNPGVSASQTVTNVYTTFDWTLPASEVEDMLDTPANNFGWILVGNESVPANRTVKWFASSEFGTAGSRPKLIVTFTRPLP